MHKCVYYKDWSSKDQSFYYLCYDYDHVKRLNSDVTGTITIYGYHFSWAAGYKGILYLWAYNV